MTGQPRNSGRRGILFDLDGVLWHSSQIHEQVFNDVCHRHGLQPVSYDQLAGRTTRASWQLILAENGRSVDPPMLHELATEKQELARRRLLADPPISEEIGHVAALPREEVCLGLVTGASAATASIFIGAAGITFDAVVTGESVPSGKPSPEPYLAAVGQCNLVGGDCWVLEDSAQGLESAVLAGTHCVHLTDKGESCVDHHPKVESCVRTIREFIVLAGVLE